MIFNGVAWQIYATNFDSPLLLKSNGERVVGVTDRNARSVYVSDMLEGKFLWKVICHELCHCAMFSYGVHLDMKTEEIVADIIATYGAEIIAKTNSIFENMRGVA